jgi:hypothetical protein
MHIPEVIYFGYVAFSILITGFMIWFVITIEKKGG